MGTPTSRSPACSPRQKGALFDGAYAAAAVVARAPVRRCACDYPRFPPPQVRGGGGEEGRRRLVRRCPLPPHCPSPALSRLAVVVCSRLVRSFLVSPVSAVFSCLSFPGCSHLASISRPSPLVSLSHSCLAGLALALSSGLFSFGSPGLLSVLNSSLRVWLGLVWFGFGSRFRFFSSRQKSFDWFGFAPYTGMAR